MDMTPAARARELALSVEAKKHALRQQQDGCWIMTLRVHQNDMPEQIMKAPMGTRYMLALVEIADNEEPAEPAPPVSPTPPVRADRKTPAQIAGYLCTTPLFQTFLREKHYNSWAKCFTGDETLAQHAAAIVRDLCGVDSRREITTNNADWSALLLQFKLWEREAEVVPT